jgi:outer membrane protein OmpA-like peptidoglycan-associated protein
MKEKASHNFLTSSFTDLMASLAVIFILLTVVFIRSASQRSQKGKEAVRSGITEVLEKNKLPLEQDPNDPLTLSVRVSENLLKFPVNSASLSAAGENFLENFFPELAKQLCSSDIRSRLDAVVIEGHTDRSGEMSADGNGISRNIRLSQNRSFSVLSKSLSAVRQDASLYDCMLKLALASGRGSSTPLEIDGVYSADQSRRVEIKIRVKSNEQEYFLKDKNKL